MRRAALTALLAGVVVVAVGASVHLSPFVALRPLDQPAAWAAAGLVLATAAAALAYVGWLRHRPRPLAARLALAAAVAAVPVAGLPVVGVLLVAYGSFGGEVVATATSADGRYELRLVEGAGPVAPDPAWEVRLRERRGPLSRERVVWRSVEHPRVTAVRFTGRHAIEVIDGEGRVYAATFSPRTLKTRDPLRPVAAVRP